MASGVVKTEFFNIQDIPDGTVDTIVQTIASYLSMKSVDINKLRGFTSDSASVIVGRHKGVKQLSLKV